MHSLLSVARSHARHFLAASALVLFAGLTSCGGDDTTSPTLATGTYVATVFRVVPTGQAPIDVLAAGGSLSITIAGDRTTTGTLVLPSTVTGGAALDESMAGTAVQTGTTIRFQQSADTFVRDLTWQLAQNALSVVDQTAGTASFTITLTRQ